MVAFDPRGYGKSIPPKRDFPKDFFERDANDAAELMLKIGKPYVENVCRQQVRFLLVLKKAQLKLKNAVCKRFHLLISEIRVKFEKDYNMNM